MDVPPINQAFWGSPTGRLSWWSQATQHRPHLGPTEALAAVLLQGLSPKKGAPSTGQRERDVVILWEFP